MSTSDYKNRIGAMVVDITLSDFPVGNIFEVSEHGFYMSYVPDHFYAWRDEGVTWVYFHQHDIFGRRLD